MLCPGWASKRHLPIYSTGEVTLPVGRGLIAYIVAMLLHVVTSQDWTKKARPMARIVVVPQLGSAANRGRRPGRRGESERVLVSPALVSLQYLWYVVARMMLAKVTVDRVITVRRGRVPRELIPGSTVLACCSILCSILAVVLHSSY